LTAPEAALGGVAAEAAGCQACPLWRDATQTVFGEGPVPAPLMLVGEQPGDQEDKAGHPFVGPAGRLLDRALEHAGIDRGAVYVTNAVKHFKFERTGKRRIHKRPTAGEVAACRPWLDAELTHVRPDVLVCLGATAAQALLGPRFRVTEARGKPVEGGPVPWIVATVHPSSLLRIREPDERSAAMDAFVHDLAVAAGLAGRGPAGSEPG
jgi:DNA polymerase